MRDPLPQRFTVHASRFVSHNSYLLAALLIACLAAYPLLAEPGLLNTRGGGDSPFLLQRLQQLETALGDGHFPVRWMPDANYGYGYPFYNFYAPLSIYITAVFRLLGFGFIQSIQLSQLLGFLVAAWGMFQLGKRWWGHEAAGFITAVAYTLAPFHLVNIYVRGDSLAEFWAMAFYPLVILTADDLLKGEGQRAKRVATAAYASAFTHRLSPRILHFALAYAALILSHNISALIFTPFLGLFILWRWWQLKKKRLPNADTFPRPSPLASRLSLFPPLLSLLLALTLSAWFFLPALAEQSLAQLGPVTEGYFHYSNHFRGTDLVQSSFYFDYNPDAGTAFRMGLVQAVTAVLALLLILIRRFPSIASQLLLRPGSEPAPSLPRGQTRSPAPLLLTVLIATFMITPLSRPLWDHLPLLPFTQFPWRFLSVQAFGIALMVGSFAFLPWQRLMVAGTAALLLLSALGHLPTDYLSLTDSDITAERLAQYEWFTGNIGTTVSAEYLPPTVQPRPVTSPWLISGERWQVTALTGEAVTAVLSQQRTSRQSWQIETAAATPLIFPTLYWPGWQAEIDGTAADIQPAPGSGLILLTIPPGTHTVQLRLGRTPVRLIAEWISLLALLVAIWLARPDRLAKPARAYAYPLLALVLVALISRLWPERDLPANNLTWDFAQMGYLQHGSVPFDNGGVLQSYGYSEETAVSQRPFRLTLSWQGASTTATINLHTPAIHRTDNAPALASQTRPLQPGANEFTFTLPVNVPTGLVVPQLVIADGRPLMASGRSRGILFLRPLYVASLPEAADHSRLDVRALAAEPGANGGLELQLAWFTPQPLSHNYNVSLRLVDINGEQLTQFDTQPGYGFRPSSSWPAGQWVNDWLGLPLPDDALLTNAALVLRLYDVASQEVVLTRRLGELEAQGTFRPNEPEFVLPSGIEQAAAVFGDIIQLQGYQMEQTAGTLHLTLYWQALSDGQTDYTRFVHLIDPTVAGPPLSQVDGLPRHNSYPTSQWTAGEIISDGVTLPLLNVAPGDYQLVVGFYGPDEGLPRLTAVGANGVPLPDNAVPLPPTITVPFMSSHPGRPSGNN